MVELQRSRQAGKVVMVRQKWDREEESAQMFYELELMFRGIFILSCRSLKVKDIVSGYAGVNAHFAKVA